MVVVVHVSDAGQSRVADALLLASRALVAIAARSLAQEVDITRPQYRALVVVGSRPATTMSEFGTALDIHTTTRAA
jgi:hypothetical protein